MTPAEFKTIRHALGLSAQGLARLLQISDGRTIRRWEAGDRNSPGTVRVLMRLLRNGEVSLDALRRTSTDLT